MDGSRRGLVGARQLLYFYARRLRVHATQELLAGVGVAVAVALVFAVSVASGSLASSAGDVVHAVIGPAGLQLHARGPEGIAERELARVEQLPGVAQAAPLLEQSASIVGPTGRRVTVTVAGTGVSLARLDGLAETLPIGALSSSGIGVSKTTAEALGITRRALRHRVEVSLELRGRLTRMAVSAVLGPEAAGALSRAQIAVMALGRLQRLAGLQGRVTRILVQSKTGRQHEVAQKLRDLADGRMTVAAADQDLAVLHQALQPSSQASGLFAGLSALLGFLFAFNAMLLTVPERREAIADLRLDGAGRIGVVQMVLFQAVCLGVAASAVGLMGGYFLSLGVFREASPGYLAQAFTLGTGLHIGIRPVLLAFGGGVAAMCLASLIPLQDLRRGRPVDAVFSEGARTTDLLATTRRRLGIAAALLVAAAALLFALLPGAALIACVMLALATMLAVPVMLAGILGLCGALAGRSPRVSVLPLALSSLRATTLRSLALAATGAVALFGSIALGGSRSDLLHGLHAFAHTYVSDAAIWVLNPHDTAAANSFQPGHEQARLAVLPGVARVEAFQSEFATIGNRRVWLIARPADARTALLQSQIVEGNATRASARIQAGGWIAVSKQIADERHARIGGPISLPTPSGTINFKLAATTTNFGWTSGVVLMTTSDYTRAWKTTAPTALGVELAPGTPVAPALRAVIGTLGPGSGLEAITAPGREHRFDAIAGEGLAQLGQIASLLVAAAILAMAAALGSSIWHRRESLAELRLDGASRRQMRLVLLVEATLMLSAGCIAGALAGMFGQVIIDGYLKHVTGFPVASVTTGARPLEIFVVVVAAVLAIIALPGWLASRVPAKLALSD